MLKPMLAVMAVSLAASAVPAEAYERYPKYRGEYNRYNPDSRNPELERRWQTRKLWQEQYRETRRFHKRKHHGHSKRRWWQYD